MSDVSRLLKSSADLIPVLAKIFLLRLFAGILPLRFLLFAVAIVRE